MKLFKTLLFITLLLPLGCKNDIDINAPYKDVAIVYGFLDQNEPIQYIRIQKLYQNSSTSNTSEGANIADSLYFDSLVVKLVNIVTKDTFTCIKVDSIPKNLGFFSSAKNTLYACTFPKNNLANELFELRIFYPKKNALFISRTNIVKDAVIPFRKVVLKTVPANHIFSFKFTTAKNAAMYDLTIRYFYKEMDAADNSIYEIKHIDYSVAKGKLYPAESDRTENIGSRTYIDYLKLRIPNDVTKKRTSIGITYMAYGGSEEFQTMLDLSSPNLSIAQKNPEFSNISNGLGIFTSRNYVSTIMEIDPFTVSLLGDELPNFID
ncbi:MAG: hypothetical protein SGJ00_14815 [bacterium]|nr:hypothetical protein [bacterium]